MICTESTSPNTTPISSPHSNPNLSVLYSQQQMQNIIRNTQYNILINNPQLQNKTLTSQLTHTSNLLRIRNITNHSKISIKALANNSYIQKLRTIIFIIFTQNYESMWDHPQASPLNDQQQPSIYCKWRYAKNQIRLACYQDSMTPLDMKYMAEFFQFLDYDFQRKAKNYLSDIGEKQEQKQKVQGDNLVMKLLNKYPIIDDILIKMLMRMIKVLCHPASLDDNHNITKFMEQKLSLKIVFLSNWQFNLEHIKVQIGKNMFTLDNNLNNYFNNIVSNLTASLQPHGLDVSNVRTPDSHTFTKMDQSFICDLAQLSQQDMFNNEAMVKQDGPLNKRPQLDGDFERFAFEIQRAPILTTSKHSESYNEINQFQNHQNFDVQQYTEVMSASSKNSKGQQVISEIPISPSESPFDLKQNQQEKSSFKQNELINCLKTSSHVKNNDFIHGNGFDRNELSEFNMKNFWLNSDKSTIAEAIRHSSPSVRQQSLSFAVQNQQSQESKGSAIRTTSTREEGHHFISQIYDNQFQTPRKQIWNPQKNEKSFMEVCQDIEKIVENINKNILQDFKQKDTNRPNSPNQLSSDKNLFFPKQHIQKFPLQADQFVIPNLIRRANRQSSLPGFLSRKSNKSSREYQKDNSVEFHKNGNHQSLRQLKVQPKIQRIPQKTQTGANHKSHFVSFGNLQHKNPINKILFELASHSDSSLKAKRQGITITQPKSILAQESEISNI